MLFCTANTYNICQCKDNVVAVKATAWIGVLLHNLGNMFTQPYMQHLVMCSGPQTKYHHDEAIHTIHRYGISSCHTEDMH